MDEFRLLKEVAEDVGHLLVNVDVNTIKKEEGGNSEGWGARKGFELGDCSVTKGIELGTMEDAVEGGVRDMRAERAVGGEGGVAPVEELVSRRDPEEEAVDCSDGADRSILDVFENRRDGSAIRLGKE
jgi:hypothetical protein